MSASRASIYGLVCPFCRSGVPEEATVCAQCGARKGVQADREKGSGLLVRFGFWLCSVFPAWAAVVLAPWWVYSERGASRIHAPWADQFHQFLTDQSAFVVALIALAVGVVMFVIARMVSWAWRWVMGSFMDPIWMR